MSWSVGATGKAAAVGKAIAKQFADAGKCVEPEESIRQAALAVISAAIAGQAGAVAVRRERQPERAAGLEHSQQ
jgi:hypothetical protein